MLVIILFSTIFALVRSLSSRTQGSPETPYGLAFSTTTIYASRFNASGSIEVTRLLAGREYLQYYSNVLGNLKMSISDSTGSKAYYKLSAQKNVVAMLRKEVATMTNSLAKQLGYMPDYAAVFLPPVFDSWIQVAAQEAVFPNGSDDAGIINYGSSLNVACEGFDFLEGEHIGRTPEECNDEDGPETMILVLEYEKDYLHAGLLEIYWEWELFPVNSEDICLECGEQSREQSSEQAYAQRVQRFLGDFIDKALNGYYRHERDNIRAIVLAGEASPSAFDQLGAIARTAVGTDVVKVATGINPPDVLAYGAAAYARKAQKYKNKVPTHWGNMIPYEEYYVENERMGIKNYRDEL